MKRIPKDVWITAGVLVAVTACFGAFVLYPAYRERQTNTARLEGAKARLAEVNASQVELDQLSVEVAELRELAAADEYFVPEEPELSPLLRGWTESIRKQGIQDQELVTQDFKQFAEYSVIPVSLEFESGFAQVRAALEAIETHRRLTAVEHMELRVRSNGRSDEAETDPLVEASLSMNTYFTEPQEDQP